MPYYYQLSNLKTSVKESAFEELESSVRRALRLDAKQVLSLSVIKRSLDARKKPYLFYVYQVEVETSARSKVKRTQNIKEITGLGARYQKPESLSRHLASKSQKPVIVVGAGPAGYFCALGLAEAGIKVIILERGKPVETRMKDIGALRSQGKLDTESNICFGEGGAGAYTDGKLYSRIKHPFVVWVMKRFVDFGAPQDILIDAHPHLGTDRLVQIIKSMRAHLESLGVVIRFEQRVEKVLFLNDQVRGVKLAGGEEIEADQVVMAIGHSARDTLEQLNQDGVTIEAKAFAVGLRAEHPQAWINKKQYGRSSCAEQVGAAAYQLTGQVDDQRLNQRGIYSFCMCPGGFIVPSPTEENHMAINGMSNANRSTAFANSGVVVQITPEDLGAEGYDQSPLMGIQFQRDLERTTFEATKQAYAAPAMRITEFVTRKPSATLAETQFRPAAEAADLWEFLPHWVLQPLLKGLQKFDQKMKGYISSQANLFAVESRTSSPVRITRNEKGHSVKYKGLYPAGEGAGYAGGIVSAAVDGLVIAESIIKLCEEN